MIVINIIKIIGFYPEAIGTIKMAQQLDEPLSLEPSPNAR